MSVLNFIKIPVFPKYLCLSNVKAEVRFSVVKKVRLCFNSRGRETERESCQPLVCSQMPTMVRTGQPEARSQKVKICLFRLSGRDQLLKLSPSSALPQNWNQVLRSGIEYWHSETSHGLFFFSFKIYLRGKATDREKEQQRERSFIH